MNNFTALLISTLIGLSAFCGPKSKRGGGGQEGNGGDVIVCYSANKKIKSVELLDFYEGRVHRGLTPKLKPSESFSENMNIMLGRLELRDWEFFNNAAVLYKTFMSETKFISGVKLVDINDSHHLSFPPGCSVEQIAIQRKSEILRDRYYTINQDLWNLLPEDQKAGLIMHEILYRIYLSNEPESSNSILPRYVTSLIASDFINRISVQEYIEQVAKKFKFGVAEYDGWNVTLMSDILYFNGGSKLQAFGYFLPFNQDLNLGNDLTLHTSGYGYIKYKDTGSPDISSISFYLESTDQYLKLGRTTINIDAKTFTGDVIAFSITPIKAVRNEDSWDIQGNVHVKTEGELPKRCTRLLYYFATKNTECLAVP